MAQICPYCGTDTEGVNPCPHCGGAVGPQGYVPQARIRESKSDFDWRPWALFLLALFVICALIVDRRRHNGGATETESVVTERTPTQKIGATPLVDLPPDQSPQPTSVVLSSTPSQKTAAPATPEAAAEAPATEPEENAPTAAPSQFVQISSAGIESDQDDNGDTFALGRVVIFNNGPQEITNYNVSLNTGDGIFGLTPFTGNLDSPQAITNRRIPAGGSVDVPVMTEGLFQTGNASGDKIVTVTATEAGVSESNSLTIR
jgi:hypothetical protein